jgi:Domain of unknown function (DUF4410)
MKHNPFVRRIFRSIVMIAACTAVAGCITTASTVETQRPAESYKVLTAQISEEASTLNVPTDVRARFGRFLDDELYSKHGFQRGSDLKIVWTFSEFDPGSRALRYLVGFGAGKGNIAVHAKFLDKNGNQIGAVDGQSTAVMGALGGSYDSAIKKCAYDVARYATDNFLAGNQH